MLNRPDVAPGPHDVTVINHDQYQPGQLVVSGQDGRELLTIAIGEHRQLVTNSGSYIFTCSVGGAQSTSTLESKTR